MSPRLRFLSVATAALLSAAGCAVGPSYRAPAPKVAPTFADTKSPSSPGPGAIVSGGDAVEHWWETFHDPELASLIDRAVAGNRDLRLAASRVRQARLQRAMIYSGALPNLDVSAGVNRGHGSENVNLPFGGDGSAGSAAPAPPTREARLLAPGSSSEPGGESAPLSSPAANASAARPAGPTSPLGEGGLPGTTTTLYQAGFDASWEFDFFGRTRRALEAGNALVDAAEEQRRAVEVSLLAEVAATYFELRSNQQRLQLAEAGVAAARETLDVMNARFRHGFVTDLDVAQATADVSMSAAAVPPIFAAERLAAHALATLLGEPPDALAGELTTPTPLSSLPSDIPVGVPSDLLRRRPDVRAAERELAAATAQVGVATADLFPRFSLTGAFGFDSSEPGDLPQWSSHYYSIIPGVRWPLLDWGRAHKAVQLQNESQRAALTRYESAVTQALQDVADALVRYSAERARHSALLDAEVAAERAFSLARARFEHGLVNTLVVLDAQRTSLRAQDARAQSDAALRTDLVALYKSLGGGWQ